MPVLRCFIGGMGFHGNQQHFLGRRAQYAGSDTSTGQDLGTYWEIRHILLMCRKIRIQYVDTLTAISLVPLNPNNFRILSERAGDLAKSPPQNTPKTPNTRPFKPGDSHQIPEFP